jgi:hypothetical protein
MDPTATYNAMAKAHAAGEVERAAEYGLALLVWLAKGGAAPTGHLRPVVADECGVCVLAHAEHLDVLLSEAGRGI